MIENFLGFPHPIYYRSSTIGRACKIREIDDQIEIEMDVPGVEKGDITLKYVSENNLLQVQVKDLQDKDILIPRQIDSDKIKADLKLGILKVTLPILNTDKTIQIE